MEVYFHDFVGCFNFLFNDFSVFIEHDPQAAAGTFRKAFAVFNFNVTITFLPDG
ncbi:hypothetical protein V1498_11700 [Peribacillus sp. SCS-26]|uniref:hypothetical protein n=1 Tax=Paraperibacillus marinus TaxID=3115295 RepID=UPI003906C96B